MNSVKFRAITERASADVSVFADRNGTQRGTAVKGRITYAQQALGEDDRPQQGAAVEGVASDGFYVLSEMNGGKALRIGKSEITDAPYVLGQIENELILARRIL